MYIFFIQQPTLEMMSDGFDKEAILPGSARHAYYARHGWMQNNPSVLPRILGSPGALLTEIFNSVCKKPAVARIKFNEDLGI